LELLAGRIKNAIRRAGKRPEVQASPAGGDPSQSAGKSSHAQEEQSWFGTTPDNKILPIKQRENHKALRSHTGGLSSEYAREQGWGLNEEERTKTSQKKQNYDGGRDYEYGPRDFGDKAVDTSSARPDLATSKVRPMRQKRSAA